MDISWKKSFLIHENKFCTSFYETTQNENENIRQVANHNHDYPDSKEHEGRAKVKLRGLDLQYKQVSDYLQISKRNNPYERQKEEEEGSMYENNKNRPLHTIGNLPLSSIMNSLQSNEEEMLKMRSDLLRRRKNEKAQELNKIMIKEQM